MVEKIGISRAEFEQWAQRTFALPKTPSIRTIAKVSGISKSTISYQMNSDAVAASSVVKISRGLGLAPLEELFGFRGFSFAKETPSLITRRDLLMLSSYQSIFVEAARRLGASVGAWAADDFSLGSEQWISWFKAVAPQVTYADMSKVTGLSEAQVGNNQRGASWDIENLFLMGSVFSFDIPFSLVLCGYLSLSEIGIFDRDVRFALAESRDDEVMGRIGQVLPHFSELVEESKNRVKNTFIDKLG